jgi:hypothetical protein
LDSFCPAYGAYISEFGSIVRSEAFRVGFGFGMKESFSRDSRGNSVAGVGVRNGEIGCSNIFRVKYFNYLGAEIVEIWFGVKRSLEQRIGCVFYGLSGYVLSLGGKFFGFRYSNVF